MNYKLSTKQILIVVMTIFAIVLVFFTINHFLFKLRVSINLSENTDSVKLYTATEDKLDESKPPLLVLDRSKFIRIYPGDYTIKPVGDNISNDPINITITRGSSIVNIDPFLSDNQLNTQFKSEIPEIYSVLKTEYSDLIDESFLDGEFAVVGKFYHFGDWYSTFIYPKEIDSRTFTTDTYSVILHKQGGQWKIAAPPKIVHSYEDYPEIPKDIIDKANRFANTD